MSQQDFVLVLPGESDEGLSAYDALDAIESVIYVVERLIAEVRRLPGNRLEDADDER